MPRFQISGQKRNSLRQFEARALEQGGDNGYNAAGRNYLTKFAKSVQEALKDVSDDANLTIAGSVDQSGPSLDIVIEIHANHPSLAAVPDASLYTEPTAVHNPDGSRGVHPNADTRDQELVNASKKQAGQGVGRSTSETQQVSGAPASPTDGGFPARGTESGFSGAHPQPTGRTTEG